MNAMDHHPATTSELRADVMHALACSAMCWSNTEEAGSYRSDVAREAGAVLLDTIGFRMAAALADLADQEGFGRDGIAAIEAAIGVVEKLTAEPKRPEEESA